MLSAGERRAAIAMLRSVLSSLASGKVAEPAAAPATPAAPAAPPPATAERPVRGRAVNQPECRSTRAALHDYLFGRLLPHRRRRLEKHLDGCTECIRSFIDVREESWALRELGQHLVANGHRGGRHRLTLRRYVLLATGARPAATRSTSRGR
ncbi:zf-HC2 domain-containing protein [Promicromonospora sp. Populi]|uniref:zf-HC2 domain-containing protein n=1 Tax=Promicromonospora sp. Populi TaxID=3239420 RepID=UPI0034E28F79